MKKVIIATLILIIGFGTIVVLKIKQSSPKITDVNIINALPFNIEPFNPVPEVRTWNEAGRTVYYFNWGLKPTGGYNLKFVELKDDVIVIQALQPAKQGMNIQVLTYPRLIISLPQGTYKFRVIDEKKHLVKDFFKPQNPPLQFTLFLPQGETIATRAILRDPYVNTEGKTTAEIALDALLSQIEMYDFLEHEVIVEGASSSKTEGKWVILLNKSYDSLELTHQNLLAELITKTVLAINAEGLDKVEITTNPKALSFLEN